MIDRCLENKMSIETKTNSYLPRQNDDLGKMIEVTTLYNSDIMQGKIVRSDADKPYVTIIQLADGSCLLSEEYTMVKK